jgi:hypothetical protein
MKRLVALFVFFCASAVTLAQTAPVTNPPDGAQPMEQASTAGNFGNLTIAPGGLQDWCCSDLGYVNPVTGASMRNYGHFSIGIQTALPSSGFVATWQIFGQNGAMSCGKGCSAYQNTILPAIINPDSTMSPAVYIVAAVPEIDPNTGQQVTSSGFCGAQRCDLPQWMPDPNAGPVTFYDGTLATFTPNSTVPLSTTLWTLKGQLRAGNYMVVVDNAWSCGGRACLLPSANYFFSRVTFASVCPTGQNWDETQQACVTPPPPPRDDRSRGADVSERPRL